MRRIRKLTGSEKGSVVVEFALFLPVLLLIIFSIIELGGAWYSKQILVNASREGARMGSMFTEDTVTDWEIRQAVNQLISDNGLPGSANVNVSGVEGGNGDPVTVVVTYDYSFNVLSAMVGGIAPTLTLSAETTMMHE